MTRKKPTDEEVFQGMKFCTENNTCSEKCPLANYQAHDLFSCIKLWFDFMKRQKKELEKYKEKSDEPHK